MDTNPIRKCELVLILIAIEYESLQVTRLNTVERCYELGLDYNITKITYILDFVARYVNILTLSSLNVKLS